MTTIGSSIFGIAVTVTIAGFSSGSLEMIVIVPVSWGSDTLPQLTLIVIVWLEPGKISKGADGLVVSQFSLSVIDKIFSVVLPVFEITNMLFSLYGTSLTAANASTNPAP